MSILIAIGCVSTVLSFLRYPPAMLSCALFTSTLIVLLYDELDQKVYVYAIQWLSCEKQLVCLIAPVTRNAILQYFKCRAAGVISIFLIHLIIPLVAFCFTLNWTATLIPTMLFGLLHDSAKDSIFRPVLANQNVLFSDSILDTAWTLLVLTRSLF